jgi:peptidoglycan/LPS O-acetylase OafA/YrhL
VDKTLPRINNTINFVKAIACVAVVLIHCRFPGAVGALIRTLARFAVPFFTVISGFYLTKSNSETASVLSLKRKTKHMLKLIIGAELFAFIVLVAGDLILNHSLNSTLFVYSDPSRWIKFIWDNTPLTYTHFWYLYALLYCYVTALLIVKIKNKLGGGKQLAIVASVLFVLFYGMSVMSNLALPVQFKFSIGREDNISAIYNLFILRSMPFFLLGIVLRIYDEEIRKSNLLSKKNILMCILAGGLLSIVERFVFGDIQIFVGTTLMVVAIFY